MKFIFLQGFVALCLLCAARAEESVCSSDELVCDDGDECISRNEWCDGTPDCEDSSDEKYCKEGKWFENDPNKCEDSESHFFCKNGQCYPKSVECDGFEDCSDKSDEKNCPETEEPEPEVTSPPQTHEEPPELEVDVDLRSHVNEIDTGDHGFAGEVTRSIKWFLSVRKPNYGWGHSTPRALIALGLAKPGMFREPSEDADLMKKQLQIQVAVDFVRNHTHPVTLSRLCQYINAMMVTCQDPRNFHGLNLVRDLRHRTSSAYSRHRRSHQHQQQRFVNPVAHLTLCLVGESTESDVHKLMETITIREEGQRWIDMQYISVMALSCIVENYPFGQTYRDTLQTAVNKIVERMNRKDGSFGNIYSTALAVQALLSARAFTGWNPRLSLSFLAEHQHDSGSFGDLLSTYYILPVLAKKSLASLKETTCAKVVPEDEVPLDTLLDYQGPRQYVRYSLYYGNPVEVSYSIVLHVPVNTSFFNIMRLAEHTDPKFKFQHEKESDDSISVYSIGNVPNDAERGIYWQLYANLNTRHSRNHLDRVNGINLQRYVQGVHRLVPKDGDHVAFWYRPIGQ